MTTMTDGAVIELSDGESVLPSVGGEGAVVYFWAEWDEATPSTDAYFEALASSSPSVRCYRVEAEARPTLSLRHSITVVPTFLLLRDNAEVDRIEGVTDIARLTVAVSNLTTPTHVANEASTTTAKNREDGDERLRRLIHAAPVTLFMKGSPDSPRCGFSRRICDLLTSSSIPFQSFDILTDDRVRRELKVYSDWPTYPQLYVNGELIGGLDIVQEMADNGQLLDLYRHHQHQP